MTQSATMSDDSPSSHFRVRREAEPDGHGSATRSPGLSGLRLPFGAPGVAGFGAVTLGLIGLLIPTGILESVSYQLYLDQLTSAALPPLGMTAHLAAGLVMALVGGLGGYLLARLFGVTASNVSLRSLMDRLRGVDSADEADAPPLRSADRHPDAPARRPFSAARDIPPPAVGVRAGETAGSPPLYTDASFYEEDDGELLLDSMFVGDADESAAAFVPDGTEARAGTSFDDVWANLPDLPTDPVAAVAAAAPAAPIVLSPQPSSFVEDDDDVSLPAPSMEDWERDAVPASAPVTPPPFVAPQAPLTPVVPDFATRPPVAVVTGPAPAAPLTQAPLPQAYRPVPPVEPLDLSAARLDDLLARLEAGLGRRATLGQSVPPSSESIAILTGSGPAPSVPAPTTASPAGPVPGDAAPQGRPLPSPQAETLNLAPAAMAEVTADDPGDPAFPHDPALAAALKTLRRLNQKATA